MFWKQFPRWYCWVVFIWYEWFWPWFLSFYSWLFIPTGMIILSFISSKFKNKETKLKIQNLFFSNPASSHLSWHELEQLSEVNQTCPICFGKDACHELQNDVSNGVLEVSRNSQTIKELGQTVQGIYRHGKLRFWVKKQSSSPSLMQGFEKYICSKTGK